MRPQPAQAEANSRTLVEKRLKSTAADPNRRKYRSVVSTQASEARVTLELSQRGPLVVAMYREQENGDKILTRLSLGESVPAPARPIEPSKRRL